MLEGNLRRLDNPYRYGQYEGEKMFFDNPGLEREQMVNYRPFQMAATTITVVSLRTFWAFLV